MYSIPTIITFFAHQAATDRVEWPTVEADKIRQLHSRKAQTRLRGLDYALALMLREEDEEEETWEAIF